jgi:hypothetical protein
MAFSTHPHKSSPDPTALQPIRSAHGPTVRMLGGEVGVAAMGSSSVRFAAAHTGRADPTDDAQERE